MSNHVGRIIYYFCLLLTPVMGFALFCYYTVFLQQYKQHFFHIPTVYLILQLIFYAVFGVLLFGTAILSKRYITDRTGFIIETIVTVILFVNSVLGVLYLVAGTPIIAFVWGGEYASETIVISVFILSFYLCLVLYKLAVKFKMNSKVETKEQKY